MANDPSVIKSTRALKKLSIAARDEILKKAMRDLANDKRRAAALANDAKKRATAHSRILFAWAIERLIPNMTPSERLELKRRVVDATPKPEDRDDLTRYFDTLIGETVGTTEPQRVSHPITPSAGQLEPDSNIAIPAPTMPQLPRLEQPRVNATVQGHSRMQPALQQRSVDAATPPLRQSEPRSAPQQSSRSPQPQGPVPGSAARTTQSTSRLNVPVSAAGVVPQFSDKPRGS
jgi:hypothetical protein